MAGQIVYVHGGDLWAMNDGGGNQHVLATAAEVGGTIGSGASYYDPLAIQPNGTDIAFNVEAPDTSLAGDCSGLCPGLYTLIGGKAQPTFVGPVQMWQREHGRVRVLRDRPSGDHDRTGHLHVPGRGPRRHV